MRRTRCSFLIVVLFSFVFTVIVGCNREVATSPHQAAPLNSAANDSFQYGPALDVAFIGTSSAWAIDRSATRLYHTEDGTSLRKQATGFEGKTLLSFVDRRTGFAFSHSVGRGRLLGTTDAGETWQRLTDFDQTLPDFQLTSLSQLHFVDRQYGWLLDSSGIWRTQDGGTRWQKVLRMEDKKEVEQVVGGSFSGIERAMVFTTHGIYITVDGGKVWKLTNKNTRFSTIYSIDKNIGWAWSDSLVSTGDGGNTWHELYTLKSRAEIFSLHFIDKNEGWAAGVELAESFGSAARNPNSPAWHGTLFHTKDGGKNWTEAPAPTDAAFFRVSFSDSKHGWLLGMNRLYRTIDGVSWTTVLEVSRASGQ